ncbi:MAG: desulfoferrodoxin [Deltaproteobacteria bacterium]|nr:desulfoferrodoxin [Deltaproteobacteria bacterium]
MLRDLTSARDPELLVGYETSDDAAVYRLSPELLAIAGAMVAGSPLPARASTLPAGLIFTRDAPGRWAGKEGAHAPKVTTDAGKLTIVTPHPMSMPHFIVKHTLLTPDGKFLGERTFTEADKPESTYLLPTGFSGVLWATSFCNLHDLWLTEFTV